MKVLNSIVKPLVRGALMAVLTIMVGLLCIMLWVAIRIVFQVM